MVNFNRIFIITSLVVLTYLFVRRFVFTVENHKIKKSARKNENTLKKVKSFFPSSHVTKLEDVRQFFAYLDQPLYPCVKHALLGGTMLFSQFPNGEKWMCFDGQLFNEPCIVVSFGINHEWSFEDSISGLRCEVFAFDPTMNVKNHERSELIHFYNLGLSNQSSTIMIGNVSSEVERYENILKMLDLHNKEITYLKMDVEGFELNFFNDVLNTNPNILKNVNQLAVEIHPLRFVEGTIPGQTFKEYWEYFQKLEHLGFRLAFVDINKNPKAKYTFDGKERSWWYELVWINQL
ncbi:UNVERIFIED_CONTAM: hypothetical protein RMT77_001135 [Armadillidium vulgare]